MRFFPNSRLGLVRGLFVGAVCLGLCGCGDRVLSARPGLDGSATEQGVADAGTDLTDEGVTDAGTDLADRIGPVDLTQAPPTLSLSCDGVPSLAFEMPCLVGQNLSGNGGTGWHAIECHLAQAGDPVVLSFILPLATIRKDPGTVVHFPGAPMIRPPSDGSIVLAGQLAKISSVTGDLSFSKVDPAARAFIGAFTGTVVWTTANGSQISCHVDGPFWGAPGGFI